MADKSFVSIVFTVMLITGFLVLTDLPAYLQNQVTPIVLKVFPEQSEVPDTGDMRERTSPVKNKITWDATGKTNCTESLAPEHILYNAIGNSGDGALANVVCDLQKRNHFQCVQKEVLGEKHFLEVSEDVRRGLVEDVMEGDIPSFLYSHFKYIDFSRYGYKNPLYINVIRDPVEHIASIYNWSQHTHRGSPGAPKTFEECVDLGHADCMQKYSQEIPFFVDRELCSMPNDHCLAKAKQTLLNEYLLVGITEDLHAFIYLLEKLRPSFFKGAFRAFAEKEMIGHFKTINLTVPNGLSHIVPDHTRTKMKEHLKFDYDLYTFARTLFYNKLSLYPYQEECKELMAELQQNE